ncbi:helix-turn-helix domain-containing protein [Streptomyces flavofungini]|uniref:Helix-turn-helix domain-containing protein n=1 Tax=Streptomyces flavofungini TaxID=68200 RepID=A0ABS0X9S9_9ACTN|nr:helix-turn-helix transcriptional regulator [Streptomyces flavofungini]MBJ3809761.1 helix-turn-helix domain-containing protein [Streptomyces flavofungini]GHC80587.1 transcriptional regulator [Streptomyces flavofungini]
MESENPLGQFLRARRTLLRPEDIGLKVSDRRRVPGLRREEVAALADVSFDYYVRLEQGRARHPSAQVVEALARALELGPDAAEQLRQLVRPHAAPTRTHSSYRSEYEAVSPTLLRMPADWHRTPAVGLGHGLLVLAHNALGRALFAGHAHSGDLLRMVFFDRGARDFYPDRERVAENAVAALRPAAGSGRPDPVLVRTIGELSVRSPEFRRLWARHDVRRKTCERKRFRHPLVGELTLDYESMTVNSAPGQQLVVYQAAPDSASAQALTLLGALAAGAGPAGSVAPAAGPVVVPSQV